MGRERYIYIIYTYLYVGSQASTHAAYRWLFKPRPSHPSSAACCLLAPTSGAPRLPNAEARRDSTNRPPCLALSELLTIIAKCRSRGCCGLNSSSLSVESMRRHPDLTAWLVLLLLAPLHSFCLVVHGDRWQPYQHQPGTGNGQLPLGKHRLGEISAERAYAATRLNLQYC